MKKFKLETLIITIIVVFVFIFATGAITITELRSGRIESTCKKTELYTSSAVVIYDCSGVDMRGL
jgi:hypothetical protein